MRTPCRFRAFWRSIHTKRFRETFSMVLCFFPQLNEALASRIILLSCSF